MTLVRRISDPDRGQGAFQAGELIRYDQTAERIPNARVQLHFSIPYGERSVQCDANFPLLHKQ